MLVKGGPGVFMTTANFQQGFWSAGCCAASQWEAISGICAANQSEAMLENNNWIAAISLHIALSQTTWYIKNKMIPDWRPLPKINVGLHQPRQISDKVWEYNQSCHLHYLFIKLCEKKNNVASSKLIQIWILLRRYGGPMKYICLFFKVK